ncbi:MAG: serine hydrolase [Deltaproteobacteria bacterium]|nr:serine hydrolase [Deltaproteobacteria bacterium]
MQSRIFHVFLMCLLLTFSALGVSSCSTSTSGGQPFSQDVQDKLNSAVDAKMAEFGVPGVIVGVWVPGKGEWISCKGVGDIKTGTGPTIYDHVRIASITKTFTATVILQLADEKRLKLTDTLDMYDLGVTVPNREKITIRNLLNMTSGLFNFTSDVNFWPKFLADPTAVWTPKQLVDMSIAHGVVAPPGQSYDYNNTNYVLLGMIIEKLTGNTVGAEIKSRIIDKLGLQNTIFPTTAEMPVPFMHGYRPDIADTSGPAVIDMSVESPTPIFTAGCMISDLMDIKTWLQTLASGMLLSPEMHKEQLSFASPNTSSYGLGVMNFGGLLIGHSGEWPGYNNAAYTQAGGNGVTIIVFTNRYPSKIEGAVDQFTVEIIKVIADLFP